MVSIDRNRIIPFLDAYKSYIDVKDPGEKGGRSFINPEEEYKWGIPIRATEALQSNEWTDTLIGEGVIGDHAIKAVQRNENLVGRYQVTSFSNKVKENAKVSEQVLYDLYHEHKERECFDRICALFGKKYDLVAYLYFILDPSKYLPIRPMVFDEVFQKLEIDFKTEGRCSWDNYQEYLALIDTVKCIMQDYYQMDDIDLLDAHSFLWTVNLITLDTDSINKETLDRENKVQIGTKVFHSYYGEGTIDEIKEEHFYVKFGEKLRLFPCSEAFKKGYMQFSQQELRAEDIRHRILVIKINCLYRKGMTRQEIYDVCRGIWRISKINAETVEYVFAVYNSLIVAVFKPTKWFSCKDAPELRPRPEESLEPGDENRLFFIDESFVNGSSEDANEQYYIGKTIVNLKSNQKAQNPITYLMPLKK